MLTTRVLLTTLAIGITSMATAQTKSAGNLVAPRWLRAAPADSFSPRMPEAREPVARFLANAQAQPGGALPPDTAQRKGFIIGFGAGPGLHRRAEISVENQSGTVIFSIPGTSSFTIVTDFKIGYAPTDQILLYYSNLAAFTRDERYDAIGFSGGGVTYMARATSPSAFVTGGIGIGAGRNLIESSDAESGVGYSIGAGWEFSRHLSIDGGAMFVRLGNGDNHTVLRSGFQYLFY